jgi:hypothetical protein
VAGGLFNALSFAGPGFLFKQLDSNGYGAEMERHNKPMEEFTREREKFLEDETTRKDKIAQLRYEPAEANQDMKSTNQSLELVRRINALTNMKPKSSPRLSNHYKPSAEMEGYMTVFGVLAGGLVGGATYFLL